MSTPRRDKRAADYAVLGAWHGSRGSHAPASIEEIRVRAHCEYAIAFRVWVIQAGATDPLVSLWVKGYLLVRQVERIALDAPCDIDQQLSMARDANPLARAHLAKPNGTSAAGSENEP